MRKAVSEKPVQVFQIKATLKGVRPPIWRRFMIRGDMTLEQLHDTLQCLMSWYDFHLHQFTINGRSFTSEESDALGDMEAEDESRYQIDQVLPSVGETFLYEYDFGDGWEVVLKLERGLPADPGTTYPYCLKGKRTAPPEDCGGIPGYYSLLDNLAHPGTPEYDEAVDWLGGEPVDFEEFDVEAVNVCLNRLSKYPS
jgi:hypothetical protein